MRERLAVPTGRVITPLTTFVMAGVLAEMAPRVQWMHSSVTDDKIYCVYVADDADAVREHAKRGGFPADSVAAVRSTIDPTTGEPA